MLLLTDSYKHTHPSLYPPGMTSMYSYMESRGGEFNRVRFFGLQYILKKYLQTPMEVDEFEEITEMLKSHLGLWHKDLEALYYIYLQHGKLPVHIKAVPEGSLVPTGIPLITVESTDKRFPWVTNFIESLLLQVWYPTTVATISYSIKQIILEALKKSGTPEDIDFKLHDFGFRGVSSVESASIGGAAHLTNFKGTDTLVALKLIKDYYGGKVEGFSIPATEHSTITAWGKEHEVDAYRNFLQQFPSGTIACVSDSFDIFSACSDLWGDALRANVLDRKGTLVIRPDSGNPLSVLPDILNRLALAFGFSHNALGYKVLNPKVRIIQGDGVSLEAIKKCYQVLHEGNWSSDNIAFGMGGKLLQGCNRDTQKFAFKCSSVTVAGTERDVFKDPVTDPGKASKSGRFKVVQYMPPDGSYDSIWRVIKPGEMPMLQDVLQTVYHNGELVNETTFAKIRSHS